MASEVPDLLTRSRWNWLALARFVLAAVVVVFHIQRRLMLWEGTWVTQLDGRVSVIAFLVISGYSIAASLSKSAQGFYKRRLLRVYPLLIGAVVFTELLAAPQYPVQGWTNAAGNIVFPPGVVCSVPTLNLPLWSLGIEILYYLFAPLLVRAPAFVRWGLIAASIAAYRSPLVQEWHYGAPAACFLWAWLLGLELYSNRHPAAVGAAFLTTAALKYNPQVQYATWSVLLYVGTLTLIVAPWLPALRGRWVDYLGAISFPLYLVHFPVVVTLADAYKVTDPLTMFGAALAVTLAFHHLVDGPAKRLLERLV